jgi:hypothetical protein
MADEGRHRRPVDARDHPTDPCNRRVGEVAPPLARISSCRPARRAAAICGNEIVRSQLFDLPLQSLHPRRLLHIEQPPAPTCLHSPRAGLRPNNVSPFSTSWTPAQQFLDIQNTSWTSIQATRPVVTRQRKGGGGGSATMLWPAPAGEVGSDEFRV